MANILLLGAGGNASLNFVKCLKKHSDHTVFGADMNKYYLDACNSDVKIQLDYTSEMSKMVSILKMVNQHKIQMIHAQPDPEVKFLLEHISILGKEDDWAFNKDTGLIFPHSLEIWEKFANKLYCQGIWNKEVIHIETHSFLECCLNPKLFAAMSKQGNGKVWIRAVSGAGSKAALPITSFSQAEAWVDYWEEARGMNKSDFMLVEHLPGKEYAVQTFWLEGELIQSQARQRLIYFFGAIMPSGQTSTPAVACIIDRQEPYQTAYKAIRAIDPKPHGIYCVDIKENSRGDCVPMEVNYGRFFTTSDFFAEVGVNSPLEYVNSFTNRNYSPNVSIEAVKEPYHWIRGLDKEPKLIKYE